MVSKAKFSSLLTFYRTLFFDRKHALSDSSFIPFAPFSSKDAQHRHAHTHTRTHVHVHMHTCTHMYPDTVSVSSLCPPPCDFSEEVRFLL